MSATKPVALLHAVFVFILSPVLLSHSFAQDGSTTTAPNVASPPHASPIERHGALSVSGKYIIDQHGEAVSLAGPSFFWSTTGWEMERFYNADAVRYFAENWQAGVVRAAIAGEHHGSYLTHPKENSERAYAVVDAAIDSGLYVVVDWHSHHAEDNISEAITFFTDIATRYGHMPNIIYEIYNEPLQHTSWSKTIKPYAEDLITAIRRIDPDNIIVVGTQSWSQDVDKAADDRLTGFDNIAYALHFYAATHKDELRKKARYALERGLPLMVTEWGSVKANGDGELDRTSSLEWLALIKEHKLSHMIWAVSDKKEGAAMLKPGVPSDGGWTDDNLTDSGLFARDVIRHWNSD